MIDFGGEIGRLNSRCAAHAALHSDILIGRRVVAVVNLTRAGFLSQVLVLGAIPAEGDVVLLTPDQDVPNGSRIA